MLAGLDVLNIDLETQNHFETSGYDVIKDYQVEGVAAIRPKKIEAFTKLQINPIKIEGLWSEGYSLDLHTLHSKPIEQDERGVVLKWETEHTPLGNELYRFKYWKEKYRVDLIAKTAFAFLFNKLSEWKIDIIVPVPPSASKRQFQPVYELSKEIGKLLKLPVDFKSLQKTKQTNELKSENDTVTRNEILRDAFKIEKNIYKQKNILLLDDLYRSGETINAISQVLLKEGSVNKLYVLTITKTRTKR